MNPEHPDTPTPVPEDPKALLEKAFIEEYLKSRGYTLEQVHHLPEEQAKQLMTEASLYASTRLMEVEARAHFMEEIHGSTSHAVE